MESVLKESVKSQEEYERKNKINDFCQCKESVRSMNVSSFRNVICREECIIFVNCQGLGPVEIIYSIVLGTSLDVKVFFKQT